MEIPARLSVHIPLILAVLISVYGYFEAKDIRLERVSIKTSKLPPEMERLRIVQISDVHLGLIVRQKRLRLILDKVKEARPDILVSTGDLVDGEINALPGLAEILRGINAPLGKYAIMGNHEYFAGAERAREFTELAGFTLLRGKAVSAGPINIAGVDDPSGRYYGVKQASEKELLAALPHDKFTLLLKHRPKLEKSSWELFDLQLSGHAHKGQIFPFTFLTRLYYPTDGGDLGLPGGATLHVSRGSGTWGPPVRFLAPPEVTVIELKNSAYKGKE
jgi:predicted MPP superfamily phosphohydrolase